MEIRYIYVNIALIIFLFFCYRPLSKFVNILDIPDKRKIHSKPVPLIGGIIIYLIFFFNFIFFEKIKIEIFFLSSLYFLIGILDDKFKLSAIIRLFFLSIFSIIFLYNFKNFSIGFLNFENFGKFYLHLNLSIFFTVLCLLLFQNSMNMIDGINGLSGGIFIALFSYIYVKSNYEIIYLMGIFTLIIFLIFNMQNKFFMGDSGIYFLSIFIGLNTINLSNSNLIYVEEIFLLMMVPGIDMFRLFLIRIINKTNPFKADKFHIHHLIKKKLNQKQ